MLMTSLYNRKYKICFMLYIKTFNNNSIKQLIYFFIFIVLTIHYVR